MSLTTESLYILEIFPLQYTMQILHLQLCTYQCQAGGGRGEVGGDLIDRFGQGVRHFNYLAAPGVGIFELFSYL